MSLTNMDREGKGEDRRVALRDLKFAGTVAAGLVAGVLGVGALSAPLLGWSKWPTSVPSGSNGRATLATGEEQTLIRRDASSRRVPANAIELPGPDGTTLIVPLSGPDTGTGSTFAGAGGGTGGGGTSGNGGNAGGGVVGQGGDDRNGSRGFGGSGFPDEPADTDNDGMPDTWETANGLNPRAPADANVDSDGDGLPNFYEFKTRMSPLSIDTNSDGIADGAEDADGDGVSNGVEIVVGTNPWTGDTDGNLIPDG